MRVLRAGLTRDEALEWERFYIRHYGRVDLGTGVLRNLTDGGDGGSGARPSQQTREKMSRASLGKPKSPKHRAAIKRGRSELTPAQLANYSAGNSRPASEDKKQAISSSLRARHLEKLAKLGLTEEEYAELQKRRKAERRKELRLQKQAAQGRYQQSEEARENYRRAAIEREAKKRLTRLAAA